MDKNFNPSSKDIEDYQNEKMLDDVIACVEFIKDYKKLREDLGCEDEDGEYPCVTELCQMFYNTDKVSTSFVMEVEAAL